MRKIALAVTSAGLCILMADVTWAQRGENRGGRGDQPAAEGQSSGEGQVRAGGRAGGDGQAGAEGRGQADARTQNSASSNRSGARNNNRLDVGRAIENRVRNEVENVVRDAVGLPNRSRQRFGDQRFGNRGFNDGRRDGQRFGQRYDNDFDRRGDFRFGDNNRYDNGRFDSRRFDNDRYRNGRYRKNSIASFILQQFPQASRLLSPRVLPGRGAYYRNNGNYYYYPNSGAVVQQSPGVVVQSPQPQNPEPIRIEFGGFVHIGELAQALPVVANDLCLDMHYNYRGASNFYAAYRDAYAMLTAAKAVEQAEKANDREGVKRQLTIADQLMHQVQRQTQGWVRRHQRQIGEMGIMTKLDISSDMLHHMMYDVGISLDQHQGAGQQDTASQNTEVAPPPASR